jgi:capsular polysaccharide biosynthesis protein
MVTSSLTVEGDAMREMISSLSKSTATTFVKVLPISMRSMILSFILMISLSLVFFNVVPHSAEMKGERHHGD